MDRSSLSAPVSSTQLLPTSTSPSHSLGSETPNFGPQAMPSGTASTSSHTVGARYVFIVPLNDVEEKMLRVQSSQSLTATSMSDPFEAVSSQQGDSLHEQKVRQVKASLQSSSSDRLKHSDHTSPTLRKYSIRSVISNSRLVASIKKHSQFFFSFKKKDQSKKTVMPRGSLLLRPKELQKREENIQQKILKTYAAKLSEAEKKISEKNEALSQLEKTVDELKETVDELEETVRSSDWEKRDALEEVAYEKMVLRAREKEYRQDLKKSVTEYQALEKTLNSKMKALEDTIQNQESTLTTLQQKNDIWRDAIVQEQSESKRLLEANRHLIAQHEDIQIEKNALELEMAQLEGTRHGKKKEKKYKK